MTNLKLAFSEVKEKFEGENRALGIGSLIIMGVFLSMILLAPFAMRSGGIIQLILSFLPFAGLLWGLFFALQVVYKIARSENVKEKVTKGSIAKTAIDIAVNECIEAGLLGENHSDYSDCLSGVENGLNCVFIKYDNIGFCVIRTTRIMPLLITVPSKMPWPVKLPTDRKLVELQAIGFKIECWTLSDLNSRDKGQNLVAALVPLFQMCETGGEMPFIYAQNRSFIMGFRNADIGSLALIGNEAAKILK